MVNMFAWLATMTLIHKDPIRLVRLVIEFPRIRNGPHFAQNFFTHVTST